MIKRTVLFDTETTGVNPELGDRVIEIAAIELINDLPTDQYYHALIHPERDIPIEATRVHGFTLEDLKNKPKFAEIVDGFLEFIRDDPLIAHNAPFDFKFINSELARINRKPLSFDRMIDTLQIARSRFPTSPNSLDALCRRFSIDLSERTTHNALLDCKLLSEVYIELMGGRQRGLGFANEQAEKASRVYQTVKSHIPKYIQPSAKELEQHKKFIDNIPDALWKKE